MEFFYEIRFYVLYVQEWNCIAACIIEKWYKFTPTLITQICNQKYILFIDVCFQTWNI